MTSIRIFILYAIHFAVRHALVSSSVYKPKADDSISFALHAETEWNKFRRTIRKKI